MKKNDKIIEGKNGLRNYQYEKVEKGRLVYMQSKGYTIEYTNFFYTKKCVYCNAEFEAKRVDTAFCSQSCQKADMRVRKRNQ